jgi:hypothetical protein
MQEEQEQIYAQAIKDSSKRLLVLKMLSNFFNHKDLFAVYVRTKVIHNLFEANKSLDVNKLELFHIQYTSSLTDLFQKLKKAKEQQYMLVNDEIYINQELAAKLEKETTTANFAGECRKYGQAMGSKLREFYEVLSGHGSNFSWGDVLMFSARYGQEFYRDITDGEVFLALTENESKSAYHSDHGTIERRLMGRLNKLNFRVKFACGLRFDTEYLEVFEFVDSNDRFIFINGIRSFYLLDSDLAQSLDLSKNMSHKGEIVAELKQKNDMLHERLSTIKTALPQDVEDVLAQYLDKISGVDFLEELQNVDEQTNILRAMLNININSK